MICRTAVVTEAETVGQSTAGRSNRASLISLLILSAWCGLVAGLR